MVSIVYITQRAEPHFEWFADSLAYQLDASNAAGGVEVIVVDGCMTDVRRERFARIVDGRFALRHVAPKPTPYNGPNRLTRRAHSTISSARNTGIVYARSPYVILVDDCGMLADGWWEQVRTAARHGYVLAGTYENRDDLRVEHGRLPEADGSTRASLDHRWERGDDHALVQVVGTQLFGCGLGAPRELLLALNGFDELCDPIGGEDTQLGVRLEWSGARIYFSRRAMIVKDHLRHRGDSVVRVERSVVGGSGFDRIRYMACLAEFGVDRRTIEDGAWDCSHLCLDVLYGTRSTRSLGNYYELAELSEDDLQRLPEAFPERYWATAEPISAL
jgi:glycosyltransferase involved in cell wall biosynthesis